MCNSVQDFQFGMSNLVHDLCQISTLASSCSLHTIWYAVIIFHGALKIFH